MSTNDHTTEDVAELSMILEEGASTTPAGNDQRFAGTTSPPPASRKHLNVTTHANARESISSMRSPEPDAMRSMSPTTSDDDIPVNAGATSASSSAAAHKLKIGRAQPKMREEGELSLLVGGRRFVVEGKLFADHPNTMLGRMFGSGLEMNLTRPDDNGDYVITFPVSPAAFGAILNYYRKGKIVCPPTVSMSELHEACNYFLVPFSHSSIKCEDLGKLLHELSNKGARSQFEEFIEKYLLGCMARCAQMGDRLCHIVVLDEDEHLEWDDDLPPSLGEQFAQVVHSTALLRFMQSYENRNIAKAVMKDRGLKRIKIGIEGFPMCAEKIKKAPDGTKISVEYSYEQRPFIKVTWEKEEQKSRHVDFQTVRPRTNSHMS